MAAEQVEWLNRVEAERLRVAAGTSRMNRELFIDAMKRLSRNIGPELDLDEYYALYDQKLEEWVSIAQPDWIPLGLELLAHRPAPERLSGVNPERWESECFLFLSEVAERFPEAVPDLAAPWLSQPGSRKTALLLLIGAKPAEAMQWIRPLVEAQDLTRSEILLIASQLGARPYESAVESLHRLRERSQRGEFSDAFAGSDGWRLIRRTYLQRALASFLSTHLSEQRFEQFAGPLALKEEWSMEELRGGFRLLREVGGPDAEAVLSRIRAVLTFRSDDPEEPETYHLREAFNDGGEAHSAHA